MEICAFSLIVPRWWHSSFSIFFIHARVYQNCLDVRILSVSVCSVFLLNEFENLVVMKYKVCVTQGKHQSLKSNIFYSQVSYIEFIATFRFYLRILCFAHNGKWSLRKKILFRTLGIVRTVKSWTKKLIFFVVPQIPAKLKVAVFWNLVHRLMLGHEGTLRWGFLKFIF